MVIAILSATDLWAAEKVIYRNGFETGHPVISESLDEAVFHSGSRSLKNGSRMAIPQLESLATYRISLWLKADAEGGTVHPIYLAMHYLLGRPRHEAFEFSLTPAVSTTDWTKFEGTFLNRGGHVNFYLGLASGKVTFWVDDVVITRVCDRVENRAHYQSILDDSASSPGQKAEAAKFFSDSHKYIEVDAAMLGEGEKRVAKDIIEKVYPDGRRCFVYDGTQIEDRTPDPDPEPDHLTDADRRRGFVLYRRSACDQVFRRSSPKNEERVSELRTSISLGETRHVQFAVYALRDLERVEVSGGKLISTAGEALPDESVAIHPVRLHFWRNWWDPYCVEAPKLLDAPGTPAGAAQGENQQFWITVHAPQTAAPGEYQTTLTVEAPGADPAEVVLSVDVLPFSLTEGMWWGVYYYGLHRETTGRDFADMKSHGVNSMLICPPHGELALRRAGDRIIVDLSQSDMLMAELKRQGYNHSVAYFARHLAPRVLNAFGQSAGDKPEDFPDDLKPVLKDIYRQMVKHAEEAQWPPIMWYLVDEPGPNSETLEWARLAYQLFREACPDERTLCTAYNFDVMKVLDPWLDVRVADLWGIASPEGNKAVADHVRASGDVLWGIRWLCQHDNYRFPRHFAGMGIEKFGLTGMTEWTYYGAAPVGDAFEDLRRWQGSYYAYVDEQGRLLSTITWEGVREGINDGRYFATLRQLIDKARSAGSVEQRRLSEETQAKLQWVLDQLPWGGSPPPEARLNELRDVLTEQILRLVHAGVTTR